MSVTQSWFVQSSALIYRGILGIYPANLRHNFGDEMAAVFTDDLEDALIDARRTHRLAPVARVWWNALSEVLGIAIPGRLADEALLAPAVSLAIHLALVGGVLILATFATEGMPSAIAHGYLTLHGQ
jgi:hypothetical protein